MKLIERDVKEVMRPVDAAAKGCANGFARPAAALCPVVSIGGESL
jgi:hypothetical protein